MVQTPISSASRRIAEALLLCRAQDSVLVRGASMGRESRGVRLLSVDDIRNDATEACTLVLGAEPPAPVGRLRDLPS
jgi:hypothetical protein